MRVFMEVNFGKPGSSRSSRRAFIVCNRSNSLLMASPVTSPGDELSGFAKAYRAAAPWLNASTKLTTAPVVGVAMGWWVDKERGTAPYGVLVGAMVGMVLGFTGFIVDVLRMSKKKNNS